MKTRKNIYFILLILIVLIFILCACLPDKTVETIIYLPTGIGEGHYFIGRYDLTYKSGNEYKMILEVKSGDLDGLIETFRSSEYFADEFDVPDTEYSEGKTNYLYVGKNAIWLSNGKFIWICQEYGDKRARVLRFDSDRIYNEDRDMVASVSRILFSTSERAKFDEEYATPFSWSQLCKFFPLERIDEEEKSIAIDCEYMVGDEVLFEGKGKTKIYFNEQNNTITVSSNYVPKGESV